MNKTHPTKAIHIGKSHKPIHKPKLAKEYVFANADQLGQKRSTCGNKVYKSLGG